MAKHQWVKWVAGLSSVALFTGFVSIQEDRGKASTPDTATDELPAFAMEQDQVYDEWMSQHPNENDSEEWQQPSPSSSEDSFTMPRGHSRRDFPSQDSSQSSGRMRTHAS